MARNRWRLFAILILAFALIAAACGDDDEGATTTAGTGDGGATTAAPVDGEVLKVAFVHVGPVADKGWSWAHDQGAQYLKAQLGSGVEITTLESIPEGLRGFGSSGQQADLRNLLRLHGPDARCR